MDPGFDGTSLALFTGLAPAGAVAFALLAVYLIAARGSNEALRNRVNHLLAVPIFVSWAGFIASATHLGTPANALYAFTNVGSSPLSNEVTAAVVYLFFTGVYWLLTFNPRFPAAGQRVFLAVCAVSALAFLAFTSVAYSVDTVPTWSNAYAPANLVAGGALGGCSLAACVLRGAGAPGLAWQRGLLGAGVVVLVAGTVLLGLYIGYLGTVSNSVSTPGSAVGVFPVLTVVHAVLALVGLAAQWLSYNKDGRQGVVLAVCGCVLVLAAVVVVRFPFYAAYLSVGF